VDAEQEVVDAKAEAFGAFADRVTEIPTDPTPASPAGVTATAGAHLRPDAQTENRCRAVRRAFAETVAPHVTGGGESLLAAVRGEFTDAIAVALAPTTETPFSRELKQATVTAARTRRTETELLHRVLSTERAQLDDAREVVDDVTAWLVDANETPLSDLGFEALRDRHETLDRFRGRCDALVERRQTFLRGTTSERADAGIRHRSLIPSLYEDFPVDHPVLVTAVRLDDVCAACQRAVRRHLVRRV
jgi:hypothetical protein